MPSPKRIMSRSARGRETARLLNWMVGEIMDEKDARSDCKESKPRQVEIGSQKILP